MKKVGHILKELGFNSEGSEGAQKAFLQNLINQAQIQTFVRNSAKKDLIKEKAKASKSVAGQQLAFNFAPSPECNHKKVC